ncbi:MAG: hypothetical protein ACR5KV_02235 [Wolbachia sp.]
MLGILRRVNDAENLNNDNVIKNRKRNKENKGNNWDHENNGNKWSKGDKENNDKNNSDAKVERPSAQVKGYVIPLSYPYHVGTIQFNYFFTPCCDLLFLAVLCNFKEIVKAILEKLQNNTESNIVRIINQSLYPSALRDNDSMLIDMLKYEITDEVLKKRMISWVEKKDTACSILQLTAKLGYKDIISTC